MVAVTSDDAYPVFGFHLEDLIIRRPNLEVGTQSILHVQMIKIKG